MEKYGKTLLDFLHYEISQEEAMKLSREDGYDAGIAKGISLGTSIGEERVNKLNKLLVEAGRTDDLQKSIVDSEYQKTLFKEFGL